jgi:hypothetical protein
MNKQRDLLPWILGGVSAAAAALAITALSSQHAATTAAKPIAVVATTATLPPAQAPAPEPALPAIAAIPATGTASPPPAEMRTRAAPNAAAQPEVQAGQIWECTTKGVKTFSNNPCGEKASLLEVGPINTMTATTPVRYAHTYPSQAQSVPPYNDTASQAYADDDGNQEGYENGNSYTIVQGVAVLPRRRPEHRPHRPPYHHNPAPMPRRF